jgi:hypothetical protein
MNSDAEVSGPVAPQTPDSPARSVRGTHRFARLALGVVVCGTVGIAAAMLGLRFGQSLRAGGGGRLVLDSWDVGALFATSLLVILVVLLVHEVGHLLGGRLVGFRAFLLIVGPMRLERSGAGWQMYLNKQLSAYGGLAGSVATDARDLRRRTAVMVAGGPVASIVFALSAWLVLSELGLRSLDANSSLPHILGFFTLHLLAGASAAIGIATLIPMYTSGFLSDGARLLRLWRGGPVAARDSALQAIMGSSLSGVRPRDWDPSLLSAACTLHDDSMFEFMAWQISQMHAADRGDVAQSLSQLRHLLQHIDRVPKMTHPGIHFDAARQFALAGYDDEARTQIALAKGTVVGAPYLKGMAEVALLVAEGRDVEAAALLPTVRPMLTRSVDRGSAVWFTDVLDTLEARISAHQAA